MEIEHVGYFMGHSGHTMFHKVKDNKPICQETSEDHGFVVTDVSTDLINLRHRCKKCFPKKRGRRKKQ